MSSNTITPSPTALVKAKYPTAYADDDGSWVYIRRAITEKCALCGGTGIVHVIDYSIRAFNPMGAGNCSEKAWANAAKNLGLI